MNQKVLENYYINQNTMALLPATHFDYDTIVIEVNHEFYVRKTPLQLIKKACLEGGSTYDGRREAVIYQTGAKHKVPIPIHPLQEIFAFPTHSSAQFECSWIFHNHIFTIQPYLHKQTIITFRNNRQLVIPVSYYIMQKQLQRSSHCILRFSRLSLESVYQNSV